MDTCDRSYNSIKEYLAIERAKESLGVGKSTGLKVGEDEYLYTGNRSTELLSSALVSSYEAGEALR